MGVDRRLVWVGGKRGGGLAWVRKWGELRLRASDLAWVRDKLEFYLSLVSAL
jgi:hypothetical protein